MKAIDTVSLEYRVGMLLAEPQRLQRMRAAAAALGRSQAAQCVLRTVMDGLDATDANDGGRCCRP
ncbi:hypothetical protein D3C87_2032640 [compost metagenome]